MTYRLRFWYWLQEVIITGITADEIIASVYFQEDFGHPVTPLNKRAFLNGSGGEKYEIEVTISEDNPRQLMIGHIKKGTEGTIDTNLGDKGGWSFLDENLWVLEPEYKINVDLGDPKGDKSVIIVRDFLENTLDEYEVVYNGNATELRRKRKHGNSSI